MEHIELAKMLRALRHELWEAQQEGDDKVIKFVVNDIELELQLAVSEKKKAEGGIKFWVCNAAAGGEMSSQVLQKIKLKLTPKAESGKPLEVSDMDTRPQ